MQNLQNGSLVRLVQVTDVTSSNEIDTQATSTQGGIPLPSLPKLPDPTEVRLKEQERRLEKLSETVEELPAYVEQTTDLGDRVTALEQTENEVTTAECYGKLERRVESLEDEIPERLERRLDRLESDMPDTDEFVKQYELDDYVKCEDIDPDEVPTKDDVREMVDEAVETKVTAVTKSLVSIIIEHCPEVADQIGQQYLEERENIIESNKPEPEDEEEHRINFPSNKMLAVDLLD
jgi:uncharacterized alpha-E superfamily protein